MDGRPVGNGHVRAVGRALEVLLAFRPTDGDLTAAELSRRVGISRATLYRLSHTLEEYGFLVSAPSPQRFRLGPAIATLTQAWTSNMDVSRVARPLLEHIWTTTGETVAIFTAHGDMRLCIAELPSPQPLNFKRGVGYSEQIFRGASGRAILAFANTTPQKLSQFAREAGVTVEALRTSLADVRVRGFASSHNELISGAVAVAVPFFDHTAAVAGSIGVFGPEARIDREKVEAFARLLTDASATLSAMLGCPPRQS